MRQPSLPRLPHTIFTSIQPPALRKIPTSGICTTHQLRPHLQLQQHYHYHIWRSRSSHTRTRATTQRALFSSAPTRQRFILPVPKNQKKPKMVSEMTTLKGGPLDRTAVESVLRRRFFYTPTADIYGGCAGFYDFGPPGCSLQSAIIETWRRHFVLEEDMLEVDCPIITPHAVLKTSGHVERFCDFVVKDASNGEISRADHVIEEVLEARLKGDKEARGQKIEEADAAAADDSKKKKKKGKTSAAAVKLDDAVVKEYEEVLAKIDNYDGEGLTELITKYDIKSPSSGNKFQLPVYTQNLMFNVSIGSNNLPAYLRPETAQGQFLNFSKLLDFNQNQMPFASASIGKSGRNEIAPRAGLLRVREFWMAEIEHFVDPESEKRHDRFQEIADVKVNFLDRHVQLAGKTEPISISIGEAVKSGSVDNETIGYFMARIQLFLLRIGLDPTKIRFREHMENEMAHYAKFCVDAELLTSYGWIEAVGCADRSAYDLTRHTEATGVQLVVREPRKEPITITEYVAETQKSKFGPKFKQNGKAVQAAIDSLTQDVKEKLSLDLKNDGKINIDVPGVGDGKVELTSDLITIEQQSRTEHTREYLPGVIEPSFGIGRILYSLCEQVFWTREQDASRAVFSFPPAIAPTKVLLVPLSANAAFKPIIANLTKVLRRAGLSTRVDDSGASIGKRYARNDELGTPFGITVDFQTVNDGTITLRDRDTTTQVRAGQEEIVETISKLVEGTETWEQVLERLPKFEGQEGVE